jgi:hypothetical protein
VSAGGVSVRTPPSVNACPRGRGAEAKPTTHQHTIRLNVMPTTVTTKDFSVPGTNGVQAHYKHEHYFGDGGYSFEVRLTVPGAGEVSAMWSGPKNTSMVTGAVVLSCGWEFHYENDKHDLGGEDQVTLNALMHMASRDCLPLTVKQTRDGAVLNAAWREVMTKAPWYERGAARSPMPEQFRDVAQWRVPGPVPRLWWSTKWHCQGVNFPQDDGAVVWTPLNHGQQGAWQGLRPRHGGECNMPDSGGLRLNVYPDCVMVLFNGACLRGADVFEALDKIPLPFNPFPNFTAPASE